MMYTSSEHLIQNDPPEGGSKSFKGEVPNDDLFNTLSEAQEAAEICLTGHNGYCPHVFWRVVPLSNLKFKAFQPGTPTLSWGPCQVRLRHQLSA
jgi:hypothetical protein